MLSLYKLEVFAVVVKVGSFSKAADHLYLTQSAVSQHIQSLEASLGTSLFKRTRRGVVLTASGQVLSGYARQILSLVKEAEGAVVNVEGLGAGKLHIGATPGCDVYLLPDWIGSFQNLFPNLTVALTTNVTDLIVEGVLKHTHELGFVEGELDDDPRLGQQVLQEMRQLVVVGKGHPWIQRKSIELEALQDQPFIARLPNSHTRAWLESILQQYAIELNIIGEFANPEAIKRAVSSGMGISILPAYVIANEQSLGLIHALPVKNVGLKRTIKLIWEQSERFSPIARAFLTNLVDEFPQLLHLTAYEAD
jgi:DNA-binding transcriptional LysR family regulator